MRSFPFSRLGPHAALAILGFLLVLAASSADPGPRLSRREQLVDLIELEDQRGRELRAQLDQIQQELRALETSSGEGAARLAELRRRAQRLRAAAGLDAVAGPGVTVELRDSTLRKSPTGDPNDLVIHEQDLQAIVNALWAGGAEAVAINGERITNVSAVRCVGNTLLLHGSVYAPPYRIEAIGAPAALRGSLDTDPLVERFRVFAQEFRLGFDVTDAALLALQAYRGAIDTDSARVVA